MKINRKLLIQSFTLRGAIAFAMNCLQSVFSEVLFGVLYLVLFDYMVQWHRSPWMLFVGISIVAVYFILGIPLWGRWMESCGNTYRMKLTKYVFDTFFQDKKRVSGHSSAMLSILQQDADKASEIAGWSFVVLIQAILSGGISSIIIAMISWKMLIAIVLFGAIPVFLNVVCVKPIREAAEKIRLYSEQKLKRVLEYTNNLIAVKIFQQEKAMQKSIMDIVLLNSKEEMKLYTIENIVEMVGELFYSVIFKAVAIIYGTYLVVQQEIGFGAVLLAFSMVEGIAFFMSYIGGYIKDLQKILVSAERVGVFRQEGQDLGPEKNLMQRHGVVTGITLKDMSYQYHGKHEPVFEHINFQFCFPGDYMILGRNGCGKSTLLKVMFGFDAPSHGEMIVHCGEDSSGVGRLCYVPQQTFIISGALREVIKMGSLSVTDDAILQALRCVGLSEWYSGLSGGLDSMINENGKNLSKGQQMRIGIARALVQRPQILFLDEPDANLDTRTMQQLLEKIRKNYNCSFVVVTHTHVSDNYGGIQWDKMYFEGF